MINQELYISRKLAEKLLNDFDESLKKPELSPLMFHICGIGGVGKSTLLDKIRETYQDRAKFTRAFFGPTSRIDSPLTLMEHLYQQLPEDDWGEEAFIELCCKYKTTLNQLETEPVEGRGSVNPEQVSLVKKYIGISAQWFASWHMPDKAAEKVGNVAEGLVDVATLALLERDRLEQLLKQHQATKDRRELQELMLDPLPKLAEAFLEGLIQKSKIQPIVLELETYEKAPSDFDTFLCKYFLADATLQLHPIRIVMAGRFPLRNKRYQRVFQYYENLINEYPLERFFKPETEEYLSRIGITKPNEVRQFIQKTKGLPYFLNLIKKQKEQGMPINTLRDSDEIAERLLDGLTLEERHVVQLASYCRWFDLPIIN